MSDVDVQAMLAAVAASGPRPKAPGRLLPLESEEFLDVLTQRMARIQECCGPLVMTRWRLASIKAREPVSFL